MYTSAPALCKGLVVVVIIIKLEQALYGDIIVYGIQVACLRHWLNRTVKRQLNCSQ